MFPLRFAKIFRYDIPKFEKRSGVSINVFSWDDEKKCVYSLHRTKHKISKHVNLFYMQDETNSHYCWIKNMTELLGSQISKDEHKIHISDRCLCKFTSEERLQANEEDCKNFDAVRIQLPKEGTQRKFKHYNCSLCVPFVT